MNLPELQNFFEIAQYAIVYYILGLLSGFFIDVIFPNDDDQSIKHRSTLTLIVLCLLQISINGIVIYYVHKIAGRIPFFFPLSRNYKQSLIQSIAGVNLAISFTLKDMQQSFMTRTRELCKRLWLITPN